jgi:hypothetical protein
MASGTVVVVKQGKKRTDCLVTFKKNHTTPLIARCQIVARVVELDGRDDIG